MWSLLLNGYSTVLNCEEFPKQPNCCETEATEDATVREGVFDPDANTVFEGRQIRHKDRGVSE
jgi:hypothetical protein